MPVLVRDLEPIAVEKSDVLSRLRAGGPGALDDIEVVQALSELSAAQAGSFRRGWRGCCASSRRRPPTSPRSATDRRPVEAAVGQAADEPRRALLIRWLADA
jgi:hypothetical protein